jgi:hypothetical protein
MEAAESTLPADSVGTQPPEEPLDESLVTASQPYVGQWNRLVSTTNWQKGRIIGAWRQSLAGQGLPVSEYGDEAWARLVGGVTGQHVGRLRRVFARFGAAYEQYAGLYWSHFQAALDWTDAEMWLQGAVSSGWSVARMRDERWQTLGQLDERPRAEDVVASETDEDFEPARTSEPLPQSIGGQYDEVRGPRLEGPDFGDSSDSHAGAGGPAGSTAGQASSGTPEDAVELVRPFEGLPDLPDDLQEAMDALKLAILHHKADGWQAIGVADVLRVLDGLKALATAPSGEAPF